MNNRRFLCAQCGTREIAKEYGEQSDYIRDITGVREITRNGKRVFLCPKNHECKLIARTSDACPLCHKASPYSNYRGEPAYAVFRDANKVCKECWTEWKRLKQFEADTRAALQERRAWHWNYWPSFSGDFHRDLYT
jgi:hypothetical protein